MKMKPLLLIVAFIATASFLCVGALSQTVEEDHPAWDRPDLAIEEIVVGNGEPLRLNHPVKILSTIVNHGPGASRPTQLWLFIGNDKLAGKVPLLEPQARLTIEMSWTPRRREILPLRGEIWPADRADMSDHDNVRFTVVRVMGADPRHEIEIEWTGFDDLQVSADSRVKPVLTVRNPGLVENPAFQLNLFTNGERRASVQIEPLPAGKNRRVQFDPVPVKTGSNLITVYLRPGAEGTVRGIRDVWSWDLRVPESWQKISANVSGVWRSIGPRLIKPHDIVGRMNCFAFHPTDTNTLYAGCAGILQNGGGVWKSTNGGLSWQPLTDRLETMAVRSLVIDNENQNHIYFGSGGNRPRGIWKSADGGLTWNKYAPRSFLDFSDDVRELSIVTAGNSKRYLLAATDKGVFRHQLTNPNATTSSAASWTKILDGNVIDLGVKPNSATAYASRRGIGLSRSTDVTTATPTSWTPLTKGLPASNNKQTHYFDIYPLQPKRLYLSLYSPKAGSLLGLYRSDDGGNTWKELQLFANKEELPGAKHPYNPFLRVSATSPPYLYFGGVGLYRALENAAGLDISLVSGAWADLKALEFDPNQPTRYFSLGDQGIFEGKVVAGGDQIKPMNNELRVTQFYDIDVSTESPSWVIGGTQDTGTLLTAPSLQMPDWKQIRGGDGNYSLILPKNGAGHQVLFSQHQYLIDCSGQNSCYPPMLSDTDLTTGGINWKSSTVGLPLPGDTYYYSLSRAWMAKHPNNPNRVFAQGVQVLASKGPQFSSWTPIGPTGPNVNGRVHRVIVHPSTNAIIAGTTVGELWSASGGGGPGTWSRLFSRTFDQACVSSMAFSPSNPAVLFVLFQGGTRSDMRVIRFEQSTSSSTWNATGYLASGAPEGLQLNVLCGDAYDPQVVYVGTNLGIYRIDASKPTYDMWTAYDTGLPLTTVTDLLVEPINGELIAATASRGAWQTSTFPAHGADLVPLRWSDISGSLAYCKYTDDGKLLVGAENKGDRPAAALAIVKFNHGGKRTVNLGLIQPGGQATGKVSIPEPRPAGDLHFTIQIIPENAETDLSNNIAKGHCIG